MTVFWSQVAAEVIFSWCQMLDNGWLENTISGGCFRILKSADVPIPVIRHPSISLLICEPYLQFKELSRGREIPPPFWGIGKRKAHADYEHGLFYFWILWNYLSQGELNLFYRLQLEELIAVRGADFHLSHLHAAKDSQACFHPGFAQRPNLPVKVGKT